MNAPRYVRFFEEFGIEDVPLVPLPITWPNPPTAQARSASSAFASGAVSHCLALATDTRPRQSTSVNCPRPRRRTPRGLPHRGQLRRPRPLAPQECSRRRRSRSIRAVETGAQAHRHVAVLDLIDAQTGLVPRPARSPRHCHAHSTVADSSGEP